MKDISERCADYIQYAEAVKKFQDLDFYKQAKAEIDRLRDRLAEIEGQEPVAYRYWKDKFSCWEYSDTPLTFPAVPAGTGMKPLYAAPVPAVPSVESLAQFIRAIDGEHDTGADILAERICEWLKAASQPEGESK